MERLKRKIWSLEYSRRVGGGMHASREAEGGKRYAGNVYCPRWILANTWGRSSGQRRLRQQRNDATKMSLSILKIKKESYIRQRNNSLDIYCPLLSRYFVRALCQFRHWSIICALFQFEQLFLHAVFTQRDHKTNRESNLFFDGKITRVKFYARCSTVCRISLDKDVTIVICKKIITFVATHVRATMICQWIKKVIWASAIRK